MALEDLTPVTRTESILDGDDISPVTRMEYFLQQAANEVPKPSGVSDAGKVLTVNDDGDGFELDTPESGLPAYTGSDIGKVLTVGGTSEAPAAGWAAASGGGSIIVKATGEASYSPASGGQNARAMISADISLSEYMAAFASATAKPMYCLIPNITNNSPYYNYSGTAAALSAVEVPAGISKTTPFTNVQTLYFGPDDPGNPTSIIFGIEYKSGD